MGKTSLVRALMSPSSKCASIDLDDRTVGIDRYDMQLLPFAVAAAAQMHSSDRKRKQRLADPPLKQRQTGALVQRLQMRVTRAPERASRMLLRLQLAVRQTLGRAAETRRMKGMKTG